MKADWIIFVLTIALAAVYFYATQQIPTLDIGDPMGSKAIPRLLVVGLLVAAAMLLLEIVIAAKGKRSTVGANRPGGESARINDEPAHVKDELAYLQDEPASIKDEPAYLLVTLVVMWTCLYFAVFQWLGYAIATTIYLFVLMAYFHRGHWKANVLTSALFSVGSYLAFTRLFGSEIAAGLLPF